VRSFATFPPAEAVEELLREYAQWAGG